MPLNLRTLIFPGLVKRQGGPVPRQVWLVGGPRFWCLPSPRLKKTEKIRIPNLPHRQIHSFQVLTVTSILLSRGVENPQPKYGVAKNLLGNQIFLISKIPKILTFSKFRTFSDFQNFRKFSTFQNFDFWFSKKYFSIFFRDIFLTPKFPQESKNHTQNTVR